VLEAVQASAVAMPHQVAPMGITTAHLGLGLPGAASLHAGWMQIPYFGDPNDVLGSFWVNSDFVPPSAAKPPESGFLATNHLNLMYMLARLRLRPTRHVLVSPNV